MASATGVLEVVGVAAGEDLVGEIDLARSSDRDSQRTVEGRGLSQSIA